MLMDSQPGGMVASLEKSGNGYLTKGEEILPTQGLEVHPNQRSGGNPRQPNEALPFSEIDVN